MSSTEDNQNQNQNNNQDSPSYYQRKKNWISGVDNDNVLAALGITATVIGGIALFFPDQVKKVRDSVVGIFNRNGMQQQQQENTIINGAQNQLPNTQGYYYPPQVQPEYGNQPIEQPQQIEEPNNPMQEQQQQQQDEQEQEYEPEMFYDDELQKRSKIIKGKSKDKYDSPFGAKVSNSGFL